MLKRKSCIAIFMLCVASSAFARAPFFSIIASTEESWSPEFRFGGAYYQDKYVSAPAAYIQTPIVSFPNHIDLNFGVVVPAGYLERSRPSFSLSYRLKNESWYDWFTPEVGAYVAASPHEAWGVQFGFIGIEW